MPAFDHSLIVVVVHAHSACAILVYFEVSELAIDDSEAHLETVHDALVLFFVFGHLNRMPFFLFCVRHTTSVLI